MWHLIITPSLLYPNASVPFPTGSLSWNYIYFYLSVDAARFIHKLKRSAVDTMNYLVC